MKIYTQNDIDDIYWFVHNLDVGLNGMFKPQWKIEILDKIEELKNGGIDEM